VGRGVASEFRVAAVVSERGSPGGEVRRHL